MSYNIQEVADAIERLEKADMKQIELDWRLTARRLRRWRADALGRLAVLERILKDHDTNETVIGCIIFNNTLARIIDRCLVESRRKCPLENMGRAKEANERIRLACAAEND